MKQLKRLAALFATLALCFGFAVTTAACGDDKKSSVSTPDSNTTSDSVAETTGFKFKVVDKDGNPVSGVVIQLCNSGCAFSNDTDANGEVTFPGEEGEVEYTIHVFSGNPMKGETDAAELEYEGAQKTPAAYSDSVIVLTLK